MKFSACQKIVLCDSYSDAFESASEVILMDNIIFPVVPIKVRNNPQTQTN